MYRNVQAAVNRVSARVTALQQDMVVRFCNNRGEDNCGFLGDVLETVSEIAADLVALRAFLEHEITGRGKNPGPGQDGPPPGSPPTEPDEPAPRGS